MTANAPTVRPRLAAAILVSTAALGLLVAVRHATGDELADG